MANTLPNPDVNPLAIQPPATPSLGGGNQRWINPTLSCNPWSGNSTLNGCITPQVRLNQYMSHQDDLSHNSRMYHCSPPKLDQDHDKAAPGVRHSPVQQAFTDRGSSMTGWWALNTHHLHVATA